jgi:hypothetical protein
LSPHFFHRFLNALKVVATQHNIDSLQRSQLTVEKKKKRFYFLRSKQSVMRRAVSRAMDKYDMRSKKERIISKRGTMKWLPVAGSNDLIHGSWWFVFGSFGVIITSAVIIQNKEKPFWNDDDSTLTPAEFDATWVLMCICGIFSTLGKKEGEILLLFSLAYVSSCFLSFVCCFSLFSF